MCNKPSPNHIVPHSHQSCFRPIDSCESCIVSRWQVSSYHSDSQALEWTRTTRVRLHSHKQFLCVHMTTNPLLPDLYTHCTRGVVLTIFIAPFRQHQFHLISLLPLSQEVVTIVTKCLINFFLSLICSPLSARLTFCLKSCPTSISFCRCRLVPIERGS